MSLRNNPYLDGEFDKMFGELDGRLKHRKIGEVYGSAGPIDGRIWEPCFCPCGKQGGYVTAGTPIFYVCMNCTETYGRLPLPELLINGEPPFKE